MQHRVRDEAEQFLAEPATAFSFAGIPARLCLRSNQGKQAHLIWRDGFFFICHQNRKTAEKRLKTCAICVERERR